MAIEKKLFDTCSCGAEIYAYTLSNNSGTSVRVLNYGGILANIWVKDKNGEAADVICGYDCLKGYQTSGGYQGALIGRLATASARAPLLWTVRPISCTATTAQIISTAVRTVLTKSSGAWRNPVPKRSLR